MPSLPSPLKALVLVLVLAITAVVGVRYLDSHRGRSTVPTAGPTATTVATPSPSLQPPSPSAPAPTPAPTPTPVPSTPVPAGPSATVTVDRVGLAVGVPGVAVTFVSDGAGLVSAQVAAASAPVTLCLRPQGAAVSCRTWSSGNLSMTSAGLHESWVASLDARAAAATATLTITFPSATPRVALSGLRFGGTDYPGLDGVDLRVSPRQSGTATFQATWGPAYRYAFTVRDVTTASTTVSVLATGGSVGQTFAVSSPDTWRVALTNHSRVPPDAMLAVTFSWP